MTTSLRLAVIVSPSKGQYNRGLLSTISCEYGLRMAAAGGGGDNDVTGEGRAGCEKRRGEERKRQSGERERKKTENGWMDGWMDISINRSINWSLNSTKAATQLY